MIPFSKPTQTGEELEYLSSIIKKGSFSQPINEVNDFLTVNTGYNVAYFCNSCSDALEIAALALNLGKNDEIIVPDYTFVTSASSFALRGAQLLFCDVDDKDLCLDLDAAESLITEHTKAIVWVDYAGCTARAKLARKLCDKYNLVLIQDAAQSIGNWLFENPADCLVGDFITYSFHSTKNITSGGEGGALLLRDETFQDMVDLVFEKGTNRRSFIRNEVDMYTWHTLGSSFAGSYSQASLLWPQLMYLEKITFARRLLWNNYFDRLNRAGWIQNGWKVPLINNIANAHVFWMLAPSKHLRDKLLDFCSFREIQLASHYQSLAKSPAGMTYGSCPLGVDVSEMASERLVRLPLWYGMTLDETEVIVRLLNDFGQECH